MSNRISLFVLLLGLSAATLQATGRQQTAPTDTFRVMVEESHLSLRTNLLRWATLTPDLGLEWRINPSWGIAVNGSWTSWNWNDKDRRYAL